MPFAYINLHLSDIVLRIFFLCIIISAAIQYKHFKYSPIYSFIKNKNLFIMSVLSFCNITDVSRDNIFHERNISFVTIETLYRPVLMLKDGKL